MKSLPFVVLLVLTTSVVTSHAQQSTPPLLVVQAAGTQNATSPGSAKASAAEDNTATLQTAVKLLEQAKAANADMLKKQEDMLTHLDELQKAAEQLRIFAHRSGG